MAKKAPKRAARGSRLTKKPTVGRSTGSRTQRDLAFTERQQARGAIDRNDDILSGSSH